MDESYVCLCEAEDVAEAEAAVEAAGELSEAVQVSHFLLPPFLS
jgi:hypothetical protein